MTHGHTIESLIAFEERVAAAFREKRIRAPVHLCSDGQAEPLIEIFKDVRPGDWVFSTWRSHFHALLHGIPEEWVFNEIIAGRSMFLMNRPHRFFSSAIVGGTLPIALGVAAGIKMWGGPARVWCFVGDMAKRTGLFHEFAQYATGHGYNVRVVVEDNGYSTNAPTEDVWGGPECQYQTIRYAYRRNRPHVGLSERVSF